MKKTIVALMALAGIAAADEAALNITSNSISFDNEVLTLTLAEITGASTGINETSAFTGAAGFSPKIQFVQNKNNECYWVLNFTIENNTDSAVTLTGLGLTMNSTTAAGANHTGGIQEVTNTVTLGDQTFAGTLTLGANSASDTGVITMNYTLAANSTETLSLKVQRTGAGALTGFAAITAGALSYEMVAIPEPATATLSLLALAGLAARRRRK